jgi:penicillin-binding protein 1A
MAGSPPDPRKTSIVLRIVAAVTFASAVLIGAGAGLAIAETVNVQNQVNFTEFAPALPTRILDINGDLITEFSSVEKREMIKVDDLPRDLINAVIAREDKDFYRHHGFSLSGFARAFIGRVIGRNLGGGSTITQQVAGTLYADRTDISYSRKLRELWWAIQLERRLTKNEILEIYLNKMYFGAGTFGVEAASKYFFGHSARTITLAEAAILVIQLSSPAKYNPLDNPNVARERQIEVLNKMVKLGYATRERADASFQEYWDNYDYTRVSSSAYFAREDKAPWFSEYVRRQLSNMLYGTMDLYEDGYVVHTTLDLGFQAAADKYMARGLAQANAEFQKTQSQRFTEAGDVYLPVIDLLALTFDIGSIRASSDEQTQEKALSRYVKQINPAVDAVALLFDLPNLKSVTNGAYAKLKTIADANIVEGALVTLENDTGYVKALVGGAKYKDDSQFIIATQGSLPPGSAFKPLYYSAAIDSRRFTAASLIYDSPVVFHYDGGAPYIPLNFKGEWKGPVLLWYALAHSMNVPSLKVLDGIGFDAAIERATALLGITDQATIDRDFQRYYPLGLGTVSLSPIQIARAYAIFGNQGREVTPISIRVVEDRNGRVILDPEKELRLAQKKKGAAIQVITPQNAYVMTTLLENTVQNGTLAWASGYGSKFSFKDEAGVKFTMPAAGKTGTTQNWADAWTVGYTPYYATAIWFGFAKPGNSLGTTQTGSMIAGPAWADYMRAIHQGLAFRDFVRPATGILEVEVCSKSGLLPTPYCDEGLDRLTFLEGTQPTAYCDLHANAAAEDARSLEVMRSDTMMIDDSALIDSLKMPTLNLPGFDLGAPPPAESVPGAVPGAGDRDYNPLLD